MPKIIIAALALTLSLPQTNATRSNSRLTFVGQDLIEETRTKPPHNGQITYVPANVTLENWTRFVGHRSYLDSQLTPYEAASAHVRQMRERDSSDRYLGSMIRAYEVRDEALAEFSIVMPDGTIEYTVFRYANEIGGHGLVSLRYSRRLKARAALPLAPWDRAVPPVRARA